MNTSETTKEVLEEFERLGGEDFLSDQESKLPTGHLTRGYDYPETIQELDPSKVKDFIKNSHIKLLENEIEYWKDIFDKGAGKTSDKDIVARNFARIEINRLEEQVMKIKQL